ncbi:DinB family protein [Tenacibaculum singaporense]|uniref:DinB family protein n=1 Tax=Tenacibaculum singaporense TaxID=2358479 RepID=A0A3S8R9D5_9FLAO|nr:DinB family protein [Tenacibaculum singaporense]AZJ36429.1 DinB family protein [Tenacibaculum singaporense]
MVFKTEQLIEELKQYVNSHIKFVQSLNELSEDDLQRKKDMKSWSVVECLEHLNMYAVFYNEEIQKQLQNSRYHKSEIFRPGYLGNKFAVDMLPKKGMKTMNTFKSKNPIYSRLNTKEVIANFLKNQKKLLELLEEAKQKDLTKIKTAITLPLLKLRLGDTLRFVIHHNERHIVQAQKVLKN